MHYQASTPCKNPQQEGMIRERIQTVLQEPHWSVAIHSAKRGTVMLDLKPWVSEISVQTLSQQQLVTVSFTIQRANPLVTGGTTWVKPQWVLDFLMGIVHEAPPVVSLLAKPLVAEFAEEPATEHTAWHIKRTSLAFAPVVTPVSVVS
jgi:hypothetical protein